MPPRLDLPPEERDAHFLAKGRERQRKFRERRNGTGNVRAISKKEARNVTPPGLSIGTPPIEDSLLGEIERVGAILAPFAARGYRHEQRFWLKVALRYPEADLELEALKLADWLEEPRNAKARCSAARIDNWLRKTAADLAAVRATPVVARDGTFGPVPHQFPASRQRNPNPEADLPLWDDETARRSDAGREKVRELMPWRKRTR